MMLLGQLRLLHKLLLMLPMMIIIMPTKVIVNGLIGGNIALNTVLEQLAIYRRVVFAILWRKNLLGNGDACFHVVLVSG